MRAGESHSCFTVYICTGVNERDGDTHADEGTRRAIGGAASAVSRSQPRRRLSRRPRRLAAGRCADGLHVVASSPFATSTPGRRFEHRHTQGAYSQDWPPQAWTGHLSGFASGVTDQQRTRGSRGTSDIIYTLACNPKILWQPSSSMPLMISQQKFSIRSTGVYPSESTCQPPRFRR